MKKELNKMALAERLFFISISSFLIFDILFLPFVTEPFIFENGVKDSYVFGSIIAVAVWIYLVWLNTTDISQISFLRFENTIFFGKIYSSAEKRRYYFHIKIVLMVITIALSAFILLGTFSIIEQHTLFFRNFSIFLKR